MTHSRWWLLFGFGLLVTGCSGAVAESAALIGDPSVVAELPGSLLVLEDDGAIAIVSPDGGERTELAEGGEVVRTQPTWSPDGRRVAWTESVAGGEAELITASIGGDVITRDPAPFLAVYIAWDPTGRWLAFNGIDPEGDLHLAISQPGSEAELIDRGAPLWFDWNAAGTELLVHIEDRFEFVPIGGGQRRPVSAGRFRVGVHAGDGVVFASSNEVGEILVVGGADGSVRSELLRVGSPTAFVVDPFDARLAVMSTPSASTLALSREEPGPVPVLEPNHLVVVQLADGAILDVAQGRAVAWFWSPTGDRLLYSTMIERNGRIQLQWHTWDGSVTTDHQTFIPTGTFGRDYLAFFDQFDRSLSFWAPDGSGFVYAGGSTLEDRGIWVQPVGGGLPVRVALGSVASWSPRP
ncbi:MAG: hypothetical protein ACRDWH_09720 [Acidimicrobiia bacterium]